jgi:hypothetical protein
MPNLPPVQQPLNFGGREDKKSMEYKDISIELYKRFLASKNKIVLTSKPDSDNVYHIRLF